jgi:hypothetical protein
VSELNSSISPCTSDYKSYSTVKKKKHSGYELNRLNLPSKRDDLRYVLESSHRIP